MPGSIGRTLFGGSEQKQSSRPSEDLQAPEFAALRGPIADIFRGLFSGGTADPMAGIPQFQGPLSASLGAGEQQLLDFLSARPGGVGSDVLAQTAQGAFLPQAGQVDPFTQGAIDAAIAPFQRQQEEFLRRQLPSAFTQAGQVLGPGGSSAASRFGMIGSADIAQRAAEVAGTLAFGQREAERGRQQEAIQLGQQEVQTAVQNLQAQALPRLIQELGIERGLAEFQQRTTALLQALSVATGGTAPIIGTVSSGRGESLGGIFGAQGGGPFFGSLASAAATGAAASDARLKTDLEIVGVLANGIHVYRFRWKGSNVHGIGLLAQEVERILPSAVVDIGGVKHVKYKEVADALAV